MTSQLTTKIRGIDVPTGHLIGGVWVSSQSTFETRSPIDWDAGPLANVARGDSSTAAAAVEAANAGFAQWASIGPKGRASYLRRLADAIDEHNDDIATIETLDMGFLHRSMRQRLVGRGAINFRTYADLIENAEPEVWKAKGTTHQVSLMPAGPAVVITPWNAPFMLATWKLAPALAAGNPVILKPAEWSPLSAAMLAELTIEAGFPPGVFNLVQGIGEEVGDALVNNPAVSRISFTGSPDTGRIIAGAAAKNLVPFTGELGGKGALIVCDDADLDAAVNQAAAQYEDSGQVCLAGTRLLVQDSIATEFVAKLQAAVADHVMGDPFDETTTIAPVVHPDHLSHIEGFVDRAKANGERIVFGGDRVAGSMHFAPTLIEPATNQAEVVQNEIFGPVLTIQTFSNDEEAITLANSTRYGLSGIIYTSSAERANTIGSAVRAGICWVNTFLVRDLTAPFGGIGISGIGREGGRYALEFHSDISTLIIAGDTTN